MCKMEDLIDFNCSPKVNSTKSDNFPLLVPTKLSITQNENPVSLPPKENNFNKNNFDNVDKSNDFSFDPFELQLEEKSFLDIRNSIDTENFLIFDQEKLKSSSDPYSNKSIVSKFEKGKENSKEFVDNENIFKSPEILLESTDLINEKCGALGTLTKLKNENEGILIDLDDKLINTRFSDSDSNNSTPNSEKSSNRLKNSKSEMKNRLLRLSLSNALIQSPLSRTCSIEDGASPESSIFNEAAKLAKQLSQMRLNSSSPKKTADDSCDNIMEINPNWIDSESDISKDLELLKIPMLEKIDDDDKQNDNFFTRENEKSKKSPERNYFTKYTNEKTISQRLIDINNFREKLKQHNLNSNCNNSNESIDSLISNLKDYVVHCGTNPTKKDEAEKLLDNLSRLLKDKEIEKNEMLHEKNIEKAEVSETKALALPPKPIIRQGTFDIDLENNKCNENDEEPDFSENVEPNDEKTTSISPTQSDNLCDIVEQISKLVGGVQNVNVLQTNSATSNITNPTYIVVMSTPGKNLLNHSNINVQRDEFSQVSPDQKQFRRRSYSLTLPNKNINKNEKQALSPSKEFNSFKTPTQNRYLNRRNSISSTTPQRFTNNNLTARRSICKNSSSSNKTVKSPIRPPVLTTQKLEFNTTEMTKNRQSMMNLPNDINSKRLRLKSRESVNNKGPLKATVQINSVPPIQKPDIKRTNTLHINSFSMNNSKSLIKNPPIACSTPMVGSPKKSPINGKKNYSRFSTTPNSRRSSNLLSVAGNFLTNRRKSFSDTSAKTVGKPAICTNSSRTIKKAFESPISINKLKVASPRLQTTQLKKENKDPKK